jgi:hypothetical protein
MTILSVTSFYNLSDVTTGALFPSLLSPLTAIVLHSLPHHHNPNKHLLNDISYYLALDVSCVSCSSLLAVSIDAHLVKQSLTLLATTFSLANHGPKPFTTPAPAAQLWLSLTAPPPLGLSRRPTFPNTTPSKNPPT